MTVVLDFPSLIAYPGQTVTFTGYLVNNDNQIQYLNSCQVNMAGQFSTDCSASFLVEAPYTLDPLGTSYDFDMFTVTVNNPYTDAFGPQNGTFDVLGGPGGVSDNNVLGSASFTVDAEVPEPAVGSLLALGLAALAAWKRKYHGSLVFSAASKPTAVGRCLS